MKKCNNCRNYQNHPNKDNAVNPNSQPVKKLPEAALMPIHAEIHIPTEVTISLDEYADLIAAATMLGVVERWALAHETYEKIDFRELRVLLDAKKEDDK